MGCAWCHYYSLLRLNLFAILHLILWILFPEGDLGSASIEDVLAIIQNASERAAEVTSLVSR